MSNLDVEHIWDILLKKENRETTMSYKDIINEPRSKVSFFSIASLQHSKREDIFAFGDALVGIRLAKNETKPVLCELRFNAQTFSRLYLQPGETCLPLDSKTIIPLICLYDKHVHIKLEREVDLEFVYAVLSYEQILTFRENSNKFYYKRDDNYTVAIDDNNIHVSTRDYKAKGYIKLHTVEGDNISISLSRINSSKSINLSRNNSAKSINLARSQSEKYVSSAKSNSFKFI